MDYFTSPPLMAFSATHCSQIVTSNRLQHSITALAQSSPSERQLETRGPDIHIYPQGRHQKEKIILQAAVVGCGVKEDEIGIQWMPGKIIVALLCESFLQANTDEDDDAALEYD